MVDEGYAANQILIQLHENIIEQDLNDKQKSVITEKMAVCTTHALVLSGTHIVCVCVCVCGVCVVCGVVWCGVCVCVCVSYTQSFVNWV